MINLSKQSICRIASFAFIVTFLVGCNSREADFEAKVKKVITDPQKLQDWAVPIIQGHEVYYEIPYTNWPDFLKVTKGPSDAWIAGWTNVKGNAVFIKWNYRGVIVGDKNFVMTDKDLGRPVIQWIPGVYFASPE